MIRGSPQLLGDQVIVAEDSQPSFDGLQTLFLSSQLSWNSMPSPKLTTGLGMSTCRLLPAPDISPLRALA